MLLSSLIYLYLGASASEIFSMFTSEDNELQRIKATILIAGGCMLILILIGMGWLTKREIDKMIVEEGESAASVVAEHNQRNENGAEAWQQEIEMVPQRRL
jgi:hypothetical protein